MNNSVVQVSILIPTFNSAATLTACLKSLVGQTQQNFEVLVLDGGSSDGTVEIARAQLARLARTELVCEPDLGIYDAINKGIRRARGEWIYVLGSDDALHDPGVMAAVAAQLGPQANLFYGKVYRRSINAIVGKALAADDLYAVNICQQAIFYRRSLFGRLGEFRLEYPLCADWAFNIACFAQAHPPVFMDLVVADYAGDGRSATTVDERFYADRLRLIASAHSALYTSAVFRRARYLFLEHARWQWTRQQHSTSLRNYLLFAYHSVALRLFGVAEDGAGWLGSRHIQ